jgi:hypothetical protein
MDPEGAEVALEFSSQAVLGARVEMKRGKAELRALVSEPLRAGAFQPGLADPGFAGREEIRDALKRVLSRIAAAPGARTAIIVPDSVVRFRLFPPDEVREEAKRRDAVVGFKMQKLLPFPPAETRVIANWPRSSSLPVLAIGFSTAVVGAYEQVGTAFGLDVGSVEASSMALLRLMSTEGDALLVRHDPAWLTLILTRDGWPVSIRSFDSNVALSQLETRREIASTAVFWRDRLEGQGLSSALVHSSDTVFEGLQTEIEATFGRRAERAQPPAGLTVAGLPASVERQATPSLALLGARG